MRTLRFYVDGNSVSVNFSIDDWKSYGTLLKVSVSNGSLFISFNPSSIHSALVKMDCFMFEADEVINYLEGGAITKEGLLEQLAKFDAAMNWYKEINA